MKNRVLYWIEDKNEPNIVWRKRPENNLVEGFCESHKNEFFRAVSNGLTTLDNIEGLKRISKKEFKSLFPNAYKSTLNENTKY